MDTTLLSSMIQDYPWGDLLIYPGHNTPVFSGTKAWIVSRIIHADEWKLNHPPLAQIWNQVQAIDITGFIDTWQWLLISDPQSPLPLLGI